MIVLPPLFEKTVPRPHKPNFEEQYRIPDIYNDNDFWEKIYDYLSSLKFHSPVLRDIKKYINKQFGCFGYRVHPVTREPRYYHVGVSLDLRAGRKIYSILHGVLEYSGYGAVNGYYVLLSHPQIQTEDGYVFHSMYCHLKKPLVKFNSYQKMLREISLGSYPIIEIDTKTILGLASTTGVSRENHPGLYLQFSFRKLDHTPIVVDPLRSYGLTQMINSTATLIDQTSIDAIFESNKKIPKK